MNPVAIAVEAIWKRFMRKSAPEPLAALPLHIPPRCDAFHPALGQCILDPKHPGHEHVFCDGKDLYSQSPWGRA